MSGHRMGQGVVFGAAIALLVSAGQDPAAAAESRETVVDLKACKVNKRRDVWTCPGLDKYGVYYGDDDLRAFLSVGPNAAKRKAAEQTLGSFNTIFKGKSQRATIEWRVTGDGKNATPHATIVRYYTKNDEGSRRDLADAQLGAGGDHRGLQRCQGDRFCARGRGWRSAEIRLQRRAR